ncbi:EamA family transporter [Nonomuraea sp. NPDC050328]|uniref:EamA family transporter n=1 Tax=Nonomuraea sp. NPDC050328 TaxID=3364361 RepID=UPI0037A0AF1E
MNSLSARRGAFYVCVAAAAWGTGGAAGKLLFDEAGLDPVGVSLWRYLIGGVLLLATARLFHRPGARRPLSVPAAASPRPGSARSRWVSKDMVVVGVGMAVYQTAYFAAIEATGVAVATVVTMGVTTLFAALGGRVFLGERLSRTGVAAMAAALGGLLLLTTGLPTAAETTAQGTTTEAAGAAGVGGAGNKAAGPVVAKVGAAGNGAAGSVVAGVGPAGDEGAWASGAVVGVGMALLSAAGYAAVTLYGRRHHADPARTTVGGFGVAALCLAPFLLAGGTIPSLSLESLLLLLYLGAIPTALAYGLFFRALSAVKATTASVISLGEAVGAAALGVAFLGERLTPAGVAGSVVLLAAVVALTMHEAR